MTANNEKPVSAAVGSAQSIPASNGSVRDHPGGHAVLLFAVGHSHTPAAPHNGAGTMKLKAFEHDEPSPEHVTC